MDNTPKQIKKEVETADPDLQIIPIPEVREKVGEENSEAPRALENAPEGTNNNPEHIYGDMEAEINLPPQIWSPPTWIQLSEVLDMRFNEMKHEIELYVKLYNGTEKWVGTGKSSGLLKTRAALRFKMNSMDKWNDVLQTAARLRRGVSRRKIQKRRCVEEEQEPVKVLNIRFNNENMELEVLAVFDNGEERWVKRDALKYQSKAIRDFKMANGTLWRKFKNSANRAKSEQRKLEGTQSKTCSEDEEGDSLTRSRTSEEFDVGTGTNAEFEEALKKIARGFFPEPCQFLSDNSEVKKSRMSPELNFTDDHYPILITPPTHTIQKNEIRSFIEVENRSNQFVELEINVDSSILDAPRRVDHDGDFMIPIKRKMMAEGPEEVQMFLKWWAKGKKPEKCRDVKMQWIRVFLE